MRELLAAALLLSQPEPPAAQIQGTVLNRDGSPAVGGRLHLQCGEWRQERVAGADGAFIFTTVPSTPCVLAVHAADDASSGVSLDVPANRSGNLSVILPAGVGRRSAITPPPTKGLVLDLTSQAGIVARPPRATMVSGVATWSSGLAPSLSGARPDEWTVGASITRPGPWGTLLTGAASARRVSGATTLLSDVTGVPRPSNGMWSALFDPSRTTLWDVRLGVEKHLKVGSTDLTIFGDAYRSFQGATTDNALMPLPESATKGPRTGTAGRVGVKLGF